MAKAQSKLYEGLVVACFLRIVQKANTDTRWNDYWTVECEKCGRKSVTRGTRLRAIYEGRKRAFCECERDERRMEREQECQRNVKAAEERKTYHEYKERHILLYYTWQSMKSRCLRKTHPKWKDYGGRGITICDEWKDDFIAFCEWSLANGYEVGLTIDRINNDRGYSPDNCRWTTYYVQNTNKRALKRKKKQTKRTNGAVKVGSWSSQKVLKGTVT